MEKKHCGGCDSDKPLDAFPKSAGKKDGLASTCRECMAGYNRLHYQANRQAYKDRAVARRARYVPENRQRLWDYLLEHPCVDCGEKDPVVLEFDHVEPSQKEAQVGRLIVGGYSWERVLAEISKCVVRCASCHRRRTAIQFGWWSVVGR